VPDKKKTAPAGSKRRVKIRRKSAVPDIDPAIAYAIAAAVEAQDIEGVREIVLKHEAQMHTLRVILFDFMIIFREEHYKARDVVSKKRFAEHIRKISATLEQNVPGLKQYHGDQNDIDDLDANESVDVDDLFSPEVDVASLIRQAADEAQQREEPGAEGEAELPPELTDEETNFLDEMMERVSEETDDEGPRRHPRTQSRAPRRPRARGGPRR
jgi:hypothetical protein